MKKVQSLFACLMALSLLALTLPVSAESAKKESFARVVAVHGAVDFSVNGGASQKMRPNMDLPPGAMIHTGPDSTADISANGSVVRVQPETSVTLETMSVVGSRFDGDTETMLNLKTGTVVGSVKKLSANSHYESKTPNGVAGIRGTDFAVSVVPRPDGTYAVTFTSVTGQVIASAIVSGSPVVKVLNTGQAWTPGGEVAEILVDIFRPIIADLIAEGGGAVGITVDSGGITVVPIPIKSNPSSGTTGSTESQ